MGWSGSILIPATQPEEVLGCHGPVPGRRWWRRLLVTMPFNLFTSSGAWQSSPSRRNGLGGRGGVFLAWCGGRKASGEEERGERRDAVWRRQMIGCLEWC